MTDGSCNLWWCDLLRLFIVLVNLQLCRSSYGINRPSNRAALTAPSVVSRDVACRYRDCISECQQDTTGMIVPAGFVTFE